MPYHKSLAGVSACATLALLAACSGSAVSPGNSSDQVLQMQMSNDAASSAGQAAVSDLAQTGDDGSGGGQYALVLPHGISASVLYGMGSGNCSQTNAPSDLRWYCGADTMTIQNNARADTLIRQRNYEFFANGAGQTSFSNQTDSINFGGANGVPVYVAVHRARWQGVSHRVRNHTASDLNPSFALDPDSSTTWNGNTLATDTASYTGPVWSVHYYGTAYDTTAAVVFRRPRVAHPFPLSGQFHRWAQWSYTASGPSSKSGTVSRHIVITYNGTQTAQLQVIGSTTLTCDLDLATGEVSNCH